MVSALFKTCAVAVVALFLLGHVPGVAARNAPRPADLGPEIALASPAGAYIGRLSVTPSHGPVGTPLTVYAEGLPPREEFALVWRTVKGSWKVVDGEFRGREFTAVAYRIAAVTADPDGKLVAHFIAPEDYGFAHDIVLQRGDRLFTQTSFSLDMTVSVSPDSGPAGTPITIDIKGIGWRQLQNSWLLLYDNNFTGWISSVSTGGSASFTIPATGRPGLHVLEVLHGDFTFPYRNMQQSPEPDRPRFSLPFTLTSGDPILPPAPEQQAQTDVRGLPPQGELVVTPRFSGVGESALVQAAGMTPGRSYALNWSTVTGNRVAGRGWEQSSRVVANATADASGHVAFRFNVPDDLGGAHDVWIEDGASRKTGSYWIAPTALPLDIARGPAGTKFKIHLKGVGWTETANIYAVVYDNNYIGYACGFNSQGDVEITLYATGEPGWHFVDLYPAIYKGRESRPINFRLPQLTYAADHPGEDLPRFRFAFEVIESQNGAPSR
jgi:hypothetical protein